MNEWFLPIFHSIFFSIQSSNPLIFLAFSLIPCSLSLKTSKQKKMAYRAFLLPNKPCFLILLYLPRFIHLKNERSLFGLYNACHPATSPCVLQRPCSGSPHLRTRGHHLQGYHGQYV
jgi:hypothetical protein